MAAAGGDPAVCGGRGETPVTSAGTGRTSPARRGGSGLQRHYITPYLYHKIYAYKINIYE